MKKELSNLERIKAAWAMGWSAVLEKNVYLVASGDPMPTLVFCTIGSKTPICYGSSTKDLKDIEECEITGYLYAGQLAGNEPIPEGQRFMVKKTNEIFSFLDFTNPPTTMDAPKLYGPVEGDKKGWGVYKPNSYFSKEEIEPVFD